MQLLGTGADAGSRLLCEHQCLIRAMSAGDQNATSQQHAAPDAVLAVHEHPLSTIEPITNPLSPLSQHLPRHGVEVWRGKVQQGDSVTREELDVVPILGA